MNLRALTDEHQTWGTVLAQRLFEKVIVPLLAVATAVGIRAALTPLLEGDAPLLVLLLAVIISSRIGGLAGGLVAAAIATLAGVLFFIPPLYSLSISDTQDLLRVVFFMSEAVIVALVFERMRSSEARAREATKRLEAFLITVSHELRNPLGALATGAEVLARSGGSRKAAVALQGQVRHVGRLVEDLSDLSRLERGRLTLHRQRVLIGPILEVAGEMAAPEFARRGQMYEVRADATDYARLSSTTESGEAVLRAQGAMTPFGEILTPKGTSDSAGAGTPDANTQAGGHNGQNRG